MFETKLKKNRWNLIMFIISYTINNIISGIVYDVYINYLQDTSESLAKSFWSYYGYSAFVGAFLLLFISKIGYKKIVIFCSLACSVTLIAAAYFKETYIFYISTLFILTGIQLHFSVLSPYIATYAEFKEKIKWFSRAFYIGYVGFFLSTYLGGYFVVRLFAKYIGKNFHEAKEIKEKIKWFSRAFYIGYVGFFLSTYLGGYFVVRLFAKYIGKNFHEAKEITATVLEMDSITKGIYIDSMGKILMISGFISLLALIPAFLIKEEKEDYIYQKKEKHKLTEIKSNLKKLMKKNTVVYLIYWGLTNFGMGLFTSYFTVFLNRVLYIDKATSSLLKKLMKKNTVVYLIYWGLTNFGMGLFTSYFTVFLNRVLYIDKATSSLLVSISYGAMVIFMLFTDKCVKKFGQVVTLVGTSLMAIPFMLLIAVSISYGAMVIFMLFTDKCVKKFGQVVTLVGTSLMAIPFMLLIAQGDRFGNNMVWVVGISLFMRAGLMNLSSPIDSSFSMEIVEPELRPIYASIINFIAGIASIVSGYYTGKYLFVNLEGYREAYYIAAGIYGVASLIFILNFMKYNRVSSEEEMR